MSTFTGIVGGELPGRTRANSTLAWQHYGVKRSLALKRRPSPLLHLQQQPNNDSVIGVSGFAVVPKASKVLASIVALAVWLGIYLLPSQAYAQGEPTFLVRVVIESVQSIDNFEGPVGGDADFYAIVTIGDRTLPRLGPRNNSNSIRPNWMRESVVDQAIGQVPVVIEIRDRDGGLRRRDDHADISPARGRNLNLEVDLLACTVSGDVAGDCEARLRANGNSKPKAIIVFRIEVIDVGDPPSTVGLNVRCTHAPLWPQPGEVVTITAESLSGTVQPRVADTIEIWFESADAPRRRFSNAATRIFLFGSTVSGTIGLRVSGDR